MDFRLIFLAIWILNYAVNSELTFSGMQFDGQCTKYPDAVIKIAYKDIKVINGVIFLNDTITVDKDILSTNLTMVLDVIRCAVRENSATCEDFHTFKFSQFCELINKTQKFRIIQNIVPPLTCPVKKGTYRQTNIHYDLSTILLFPTSTYFWKFDIVVLDDNTNEVLFCGKHEALLVNKIGRRRGRKN